MNDSETVAIQIKAAKQMIAVGEAYVKLSTNPHFKLIIEEEYFQKEAARLVMAKSNAQLTDSEQKIIDTMITGVGALANYFNLVVQRAGMAQSDLEALAQSEEELANEELS